MAKKQTPRGLSSPSATDIRAARKAAGLTQGQAAALIYSTLRAWQGWEAGAESDSGRRMHPGLWELFNLKVPLILSKPKD